MIQTFFGAWFFLLAAIWESHVVLFLPAWAQMHPLWPLIVVCLCLESDRVKLTAGVMLALVWEQLAQPTALPLTIWLLLPVLIGSSWLLRIWLSHRSMWSALVLVVLGRIVLFIARIITLLVTSDAGTVLKSEVMSWGVTMLWDIVFVVVLLRAALFLSRRLAPYLPRMLVRDQV